MKKTEEDLWSGFSYPLQLAAKEILSKANPDHDEKERFAKEQAEKLANSANRNEAIKNPGKTDG